MKKECSRCGGKEHRRLNRVGFFERRFMTFLGYYPWECALCRKKIYLRTSGSKMERRRVEDRRSGRDRREVGGDRRTADSENWPD